ncbi:MAG: YdcF family protein [Chloroflexales bacterium]|nr:YdcF family protein [Chloroflexales bacterium]
MPWPTWLRRALLGAVALMLGVVGVIVLGASWLNVPAIAPPAHVDVIVVLAGDHQARVLEAARLYAAGVADAVWITGDVPDPGGTVSLAMSWRVIAWQNGIADDVITLLPSTSTWEDSQQIAAQARARGARSLVVVTSWFHGRRALCLIRHALESQPVQLYYVPAQGLPYDDSRWWRELNGWRSVAREMVAIGYYWQRYQLSPWACAGMT